MDMNELNIIKNAAQDQPLILETSASSSTTNSSATTSASGSSSTSSTSSSGFKSTTVESTTQETTTAAFQTVEIAQEVHKPNYIRIGVIVGILLVGVIVAFLFRRKKQNKEETQKKQTAKIKAANDRFREKSEEANARLTDYVNNYLAQYDFHDEGDGGGEIVFRDLYEDEDDNFKPEKNQYDDENNIFENDAKTLKTKERKLKAKEMLNDGITEDIDTYFETHSAYKPNQKEDVWDFRNEEIETAIKENNYEDYDNDYYVEDVIEEEKEEDEISIYTKTYEENDDDSYLDDLEEDNSNNGPLMSEEETPLWTRIDSDDEDDYL